MPGYTYIGKLKNSFICDSRLSGNDVRVYLCLKKWETWEGKVMMETMAKEIGVSRKSFSKSISTLTSLKYIKTIKDSNWDCYKYQLHDKAHGKKLPTNDGNFLPIDGKKLPTNDGNFLPPIIIPNNIPKEKEKKKTVAADEKDKLITEIITMWNSITGQKLMTTTKQYRVDVKWGIEQFNGIGNESIKEKFKYAFENKKRMADDPDHPFTTLELPTILRRGKFIGNVDARPHKSKTEPEKPTSGARRIIT